MKKPDQYFLNHGEIERRSHVMRIMFLNHSFVRHSATLEAHIRKLLASYASPGTTFELAYPDDLGGGAVLSLLEERKAISGLHHILETPALVQKPLEAERLRLDDAMQRNLDYTATALGLI